tara:strand:- start:952 stop:1155 length:204 start_codon:yes stop_codon:yes gene_type:complete
MNVTVNIPKILGSISALAVAWMTAQGSIQQVINFAGPLNEMAFCICALFLSIIMFASAVSKPNKNGN